jgi:membrane fusion protein (multidrug efflux system)
MGIDKVRGDGQSDDHHTSQGVEVQIVLEDGQEFEHLGQLDYLGNRIDLNTGTIAMRAGVPNPELRLLPGQHVRVELRDAQTQERIVVPRRAVQTDLEGNFVMLVAKGGVAERRNVELGPQIEHGIIIQEGVNAGESVITQGLQRVRNGVPVRIDIPASDAE